LPHVGWPVDDRNGRDVCDRAQVAGSVFELAGIFGARLSGVAFILDIHAGSDNGQSCHRVAVSRSVSGLPAGR
jgi:hypothetical protein